MWEFQKVSPIRQLIDFPRVAIVPSSAPDSRTHQGCFQARAGLMHRHLPSRRPAATTGVPPSLFSMDTPKVGNGRIWLQIEMMSLPYIPIENINAAATTYVTHDFRIRLGRRQNCRLPAPQSHVAFHSLPCSSKTTIVILNKHR
jgi:hypothetical protein